MLEKQHLTYVPKLTAKPLMIFLALASVLLILATPALRPGGHQLRCAVGQVLPQDPAPALPSADLAESALITIFLVIAPVIVAPHETAHPKPAYVSAGHSASLFVRPPPVY
jgi:hypothetical protein